MSPDDLASQQTHVIPVPPHYTVLPLTQETQRARRHFEQLHTLSAQSLRQGYLTSGCLYIANIALHGAQLLLSCGSDATLAAWNEQASNLVARLEQLPNLKGVHSDVC